MEEYCVEKLPAMVEVDHVWRQFIMAKEKVDSVKEYLLRKVKGNIEYDAFFALKDVSIKVERGDVYGIIGLNGSGKSTLLKIIAGVMKPSQGQCTVRGSVAPLIELGAGFDIDLTGRENIYLNGTVLGMHPSYISEKFDEIVEFSELQDFLDTAVKNYSSGMVARLAFSIATTMKPDVLICDEILSVGDFLFQRKCEARMKELMGDGTTVLLVSHSLEQIERLCNKAVWLSRGEVMAQGDRKGVCTEYRENAHARKAGKGGKATDEEARWLKAQMARNAPRELQE